MKVSVIIPTYNGAHKIVHLLKSISTQIYRPFETIVMVDGSTDNTLEVLEKQEWVKEGLVIMNNSNGGRAVVRNSGAKVAKGELLIFFDDDMILPIGCIQNHVKHHCNIPNTMLTGPCIEDRQKALTDFQKFKSRVSQKWADSLMNFEDKPLPFSRPYLSAANFSCTPSVFFSMNGFDEELNDAEDFDLAIRSYEQKIPIYFSSKVLAYHNDPVTIKVHIKRLRQYIAAHKMLRIRKPGLYKNVPSNNPSKLKGIKKIVFSAFANKIWLKWIDQDKKFLILPEPVRYKIYDMVSYSLGLFFTERELD